MNVLRGQNRLVLGGSLHWIFQGVKLVIYILNLFVGGKFLGQFKHFFADLLVGNTGGTSGVVPEAEQFGNGHGGNFVGYANRHGKGRTGRLET